MKRFVLVALLAATTALAGCNTIQGVGEDITAVGRGLENAVH